LYLVVANICILLGLSMLDVFALPIPSFLTKIQPRRRGKGILGAFVVGWAAGWVAAPCTAPVLGVLLAFVATKQHIVYGMSLMFTFAIGMGTLLVLVGASAGLLAALPRSGPWMEKMKKGFGWVMIGAGEYFLVQAGRLIV
jgi:thiol:disulfide interchange protein DsbD